jgi:hypothetical protein
MKTPLPHGESAVPRTPHAQLEIAKAMRTLMAPDNGEPLRRRRAELAAIRGELEAIKLEFQKAGEECLALVKARYYGANATSRLNWADGEETQKSCRSQVYPQACGHGR